MKVSKQELQSSIKKLVDEAKAKLDSSSKLVKASLDHFYAGVEETKKKITDEIKTHLEKPTNTTKKKRSRPKPT